MSTPYHPPVKYSVALHGHRTSISLEPLFWNMLVEEAATQGLSVNALVARIDAERIRSETPPGLASAIRVWLVTRSKGGTGQTAAASPEKPDPVDQ